MEEDTLLLYSIDLAVIDEMLTELHERMLAVRRHARPDADWLRAFYAMDGMFHSLVDEVRNARPYSTEDAPELPSSA